MGTIDEILVHGRVDAAGRSARDGHGTARQSDRAFPVAWKDLLANFWTGGPDGHCVWTWFGFASEATATAGRAPTHIRTSVRDRAAQHGTPDLWNRMHLMDVVYWHTRYKGASNADRANAARMLAGDFAEVVRIFGRDALTQGDNMAVVNASDDSAWEAMYYLQVHEVTGDARAIDVAGALVINTRTYFRGPNDSADGVYYWRPGSPRPVISSLYEVGLAIACLQLYQRRGDRNFLATAVHSYRWMHQRLIHPAVPELGWPEGGYYCEFDLNPQDTDPAAYYSYLKPCGSNVPERIRHAESVGFLGGSLGMAVLAALLYRETGDAGYRRDLIQTVRAVLAKFTVQDTTLSHRVLLNDRDAWTEAYFVPAFVAEALLPFADDADAGDVVREMLTVVGNTAASIMANCRTPDGYYSADWNRGGGPGARTWTGQGQINGDSNIGMAVAQQMMTSAQAGLIVLAAAIAETGADEPRTTRDRPGSGPRESGPRVGPVGIVPDFLSGPTVSFSGSWTADHSGGTVAGEAVAVSCRPNTADAFVADAGGTLHHVFCERGAAPVFRPMAGATVTGRPTAVAVGALRWDVFARGTDGLLKHRSGVLGRPWSAWETIPVRVSVDPTAVVRDGDEISVFFGDADRRLARVVARPGQPWRMETLGGLVGSRASAASPHAGRLDVLVVDQSGEPRRHAWDGTAGADGTWAHSGGPVESASFP